MKRKVFISVIILTVLMSFLTLGVFAGEDNASSQMPFVESEQITPEYPDVQTEGDLMEEFEAMFGEGSDKILSIAMVGVFVMPLFIPALIVAIVFAVLNGKTKKKIKEYERFFGPVPQNAPNTYNPGYYNGNYAPQGDANNQQGGSF